MADPKGLHQLGTEINAETLSRLRRKKLDRFNGWLIQKDAEGNQCTARQKAWIKVTLEKKKMYIGGHAQAESLYFTTFRQLQALV